MRPTQRLFFHDTTVLVNLHRAEKLPLLSWLFSDSLRWVGSVRKECIRKERDLPLLGLTRAADEVLGEPVLPGGHEHRRIRDLRRQMAGPGDHPDEHLGEAETITIIDSRAPGSILVTDDRSAAMFAGANPHTTTWQLLVLARRSRTIGVADALEVWDRFIEAGGHPPRDASSRIIFEQQLTQVR